LRQAVAVDVERFKLGEVLVDVEECCSVSAHTDRAQESAWLQRPIKKGKLLDFVVIF